MGGTVKIVGTGSYLPPYVVGSDELAAIIGQKAEKPGWIERILGIRERRFAAPISPETGKAMRSVDEIDMARCAIVRAMCDANLEPDAVDGLIYVSCTQEPTKHGHFSRSVIELHGRLKLREDAFALEIDSGCGGVMQAVGIAEEILQGGKRQNIVIAASNAPSLFIDRELYTLTGTWLSIYIFGDGAGAMVLQRRALQDGESGILETWYGADYKNPLMYYHYKGEIPQPVYEIDAKAVKELFPVYMRRAISGLQRKYPFSLTEVDRFYFHQANKRVLEAFAIQLGIPLEKVAINVHKYGNLSAAATPVLFDEDRQAKRVIKGDLCLFGAIGAGAHFGGFLYRI